MKFSRQHWLLLLGAVILFSSLIIRRMLLRNQLEKIEAIIELQNDLALEDAGIDNVVKHLSLAESAVRAYVLKRDKSFETEIEIHIAAAQTQYTNYFDKLKADSLHFSETPIELDSLIKVKLFSLTSITNLAVKGSFSEAKALIASQEGRSAMESLIRISNQSDSAMQSRLIQAERDFRRLNRIETNFSTAVFYGTLLLLVTVVFLLYREIVKNLQANQKLKEKENHLAVTLAGIDDAVITTDRDGIITYISPQAEKLLGYKNAEATGRPVDRVFKVYHQNQGVNFHSVIDRVIRNGLTVEIENHTVLINRYGKKLLIENSGAPLHDFAGDVIGGLLVFRDVTEKYEAQKAVEESENIAQAALNALSTQIALLDENGVLIKVNDSWREFCLFSSTEETTDEGHNLLEYCASVTNENAPFSHAIASGIKSVIRGDLDSYVYEFSCRVQASNRWFVCRATPFKSSFLEGKKLVALSFEDITYRKTAELAIRETEIKYRNIVNNAPEGIYQSTIDGQLLFVNPAFLRIFGYETEKEVMEAESSIAEQLYAKPQDRKKLLRQIREKGFVEQLEVELKRKDEQKIWVNINTRAVYDHTNKIKYLEGSVVDITEQKLARMHLEQQYQVIRHYAFLNSHKVRSHVATILGLCNLYSMDHRVPEETNKLIAMMISETKRLDKVINDIAHMVEMDANGIHEK